jgi:hypothetical protein
MARGWSPEASERGDEAEGGEHEENLSAFSSKRPSFKRIKEEKADRQKFVTFPYEPP